MLKHQCSATALHLNYPALLKHSNQQFQPGIHKYQTLLKKPTFYVSLYCITKYQALYPSSGFRNDGFASKLRVFIDTTADYSCFFMPLL